MRTFRCSIIEEHSLNFRARRFEIISPREILQCPVPCQVFLHAPSIEWSMSWKTSNFARGILLCVESIILVLSSRTYNYPMKIITLVFVPRLPNTKHPISVCDPSANLPNASQQLSMIYSTHVNRSRRVSNSRIYICFLCSFGTNSLWT